MDTSLFATKEYVDAKVAPIAGSIGVLVEIPVVIPAYPNWSAGMGAYFEPTFTYTFDVGFAVSRITFSMPAVSVYYSARLGNGGTWSFSNVNGYDLNAGATYSDYKVNYDSSREGNNDATLKVVLSTTTLTVSILARGGRDTLKIPSNTSFIITAKAYS